MEIEALLKTMMDELKDTQMMYDYACGSKKYGHDDLMTFYITRAEQRLKMFDEDHAIILREIGKKEKEGYFAKEGKWDYLYDYYMEQKCDLANKVKNFK